MLVTVVMPTFNSCRHVQEAIESVMRQTLPSWELLVVDGGSGDGTQELVRALAHADSRIRLIINPQDGGPAHARAAGVRMAAGRYVAFLDADDVWLPDKLRRQVEFMQASGARFSYTRYRVMSADGSRAGCLVPMRGWFDYRYAISRRGIGALTVMVERPLLTEQVLENCRRAGGEDSLWWFLILRSGGRALLLNEDLARYRNTAGSLSKDYLLTLRTVWSMYRNELQLPLGHAGFAYASYLLDSSWRKVRLKLCVAVKNALNLPTAAR